MRFGVFYELQLPKPWNPGDEQRLFQEALDQVELADRLGFDYAWEVEHHFLDEYSHSSSPEVFLAFAAARTKRIRLAHGIRQVIPNYNHPARTGTAPSSAASVASIASVPLPGVIAEMMTTSDNDAAEMLLKEMGVHSGAAGSTDAGAAAMAATLQQLGVDTTGMVVDDGSGLSTNDRLTCRQLITVLGQHTPTDAFAAGLPVAGQTGTLEDVFTDSPVAGRLMAKTGTLANAPFNADPPAVKSLSGYLPVDGGGLIEFAFVLNSPGTLTDQSVYRPIWDSFADVLAAYPVGPVRRRPRPAVERLMGRLAMFPLGSVALPGEALPAARVRAPLPPAGPQGLPRRRDRRGALRHGADRARPRGGRRRPSAASVATIARIVHIEPLPGGR